MKLRMIGAPVGGSMRLSLTRICLGAAAAGSLSLLSACSGLSPTYGTGTPSDLQLYQDVSNAFSIAPQQKKNIEYEPRPDIVMPASTEVLPPPQEDIASTTNPAWPETPEQRRARLRADATANQDNPNYKSGILPDAPGSTQQSHSRTRWSLQPQEEDRQRTREAFNRRLAENQQGSPTQRRYLSEPPLVYREPAATAPRGDVGEDEWKKNKNMGLPGRLRDFLGH